MFRLIVTFSVCHYYDRDSFYRAYIDPHIIKKSLCLNHISPTTTTHPFMTTLGPFNTINAFWPEQVPSVSTVAQNLPAKLFFGVTLETKWSSSVTMKYEFSVGRDKSICFFSVLSGIVCSVALCCAAFTVLSRKLPRLEADSPPRASKAASIHWLFTVIQCGTAAALALCVCVCVLTHA